MNFLGLLAYCKDQNITLSLDGEQLKVTCEDELFTPEFSEYLKSHKQQLVSHLKAQSLTPSDDINYEEGVVTTLMQKRFWLAQELSALGSAYNIVKTFKLMNAIDAQMLEQAFKALLVANPALTMTFKQVDGQLIQFPSDNSFSIVQYNCENENTSQQFCHEFAHQSFLLSDDLPIRAALVTLVTGEQILCVVVNHIVCDGISVGHLMNSLLTNYLKIVKGIAVESVEPDLSFLDYAQRQHRDIVENRYEDMLSYWTERLENLPNLHQIPLLKVHSKQNENNAAHYALILDKALSNKAKTYCSNNAFTTFNLMHSLFALWLARVSGETDIVFGTPVNDRHQVQYNQSIGLFINSLVLRNNVDHSLSFQQWIEQCKSLFLADVTHQSMPFDLLSNVISFEKNAAYNPVFQIMLTVQEGVKDDFKLTELAIEEVQLAQPDAKLDLTLNVIQRQFDIECRFEYNTSLFDKANIESAAQSFIALVEDALSNPYQPLHEINWLTQSQTQLLDSWNDTKVDTKLVQSIHELIESQSYQSPDLIAVVDGDQALNYRTLNDRANQLAHYLVSRGITKEKAIGVFIDRSADMMITLLACLKSGGAYIPLDPSYPLNRIEYMIADSCPSIIITKKSLVTMLPKSVADKTLVIDEDDVKASLAFEKKVNGACPEFSSNYLAYIIYTSGSTGQPKGVMVEHHGVINLFDSLNSTYPINGDNQETWLATTSISFDISVLELFWSLSRGAKVVLQKERNRVSRGNAPISQLGFSLIFFSSDAEAERPYNLLLKSAKFADQHKFESIWLPERHFHRFGGIFPNPAIACAAVAAITKNVNIRAGSIVLPLHDPIRVAEEWAMLDKLSDGRVGISIAPGWHPNDFVLAPDNFEQRRDKNNEGLSIVRDLWSGNEITRSNGIGKDINIEVFPKPVQKNIPVWITIAKNKSAFEYAGRHGFNVLTHLLGQTYEEIEENILVYRKARESAGYVASSGKITLMIHSFVSSDLAFVEKVAGQPFKSYLRDSIDLLRPIAQASELDLSKEENLNEIVDAAFARYFDDYSLIGTPNSCLPVLQKIHQTGVDEIACLMDFGIEDSLVIDSLPYLEQLKDSYKRLQAQRAYVNHRYDHEQDTASLIKKFGVNALQMTPSNIKELSVTKKGKAALSQLDLVLVGGEKVPDSLGAVLRKEVRGKVYNVYGPTETTIWSSIRDLEFDTCLGAPIANTQFYVMNEQLQVQPVGIPGELFIGGDGVSRGYLNDDEKTAQSFIPYRFDDGAESTIYKTGDLVKWNANGSLTFLGRTDFQAKIRGFRIELGEVESHLKASNGVLDAVAHIQKGNGDQSTLVAYLVVELKENQEELIAKIRDTLPLQLADFMVPSAFKILDALPMTPNGKLARNLLPTITSTVSAKDYCAPRNDIERKLCDIWQALFKLEQVGIEDNFFDLGGHSLTAMRLHGKIQEEFSVELSLKDMFETQSLADLALIIANSNEGAINGVTKAPSLAEMPLSYGQQRLWFIDQLNADSKEYNEFIALELVGDVSFEALFNSFKAIIEKHDILRTTYHNSADGIGYQVVGSSDEFIVNRIDLSGVKTAKQVEEIKLIIAQEVSKAFNLSADLMIRVTLICQENQRYLLLVNLHHIASDGWSRDVLIKDFSQYYLHYTAGGELPKPLEIQFSDYAYWQRSDERNESLTQQLDYWLEQLKALPVVHQLPMDHARPDKQNHQGDVVTHHLGANLSEAINKVARQSNTTTFVVLQSVFAALLSRYSASDDIVMGTIVANRDKPEFHNILGCFVNTLVLRNQLSKDMTFDELLAQSQHMISGAMSNQQFPFELLVDNLNPERNQQHHVLFQIAIVYHSYERTSLALPNVTVSTFEHDEVIAKFDIQLNVTDRDGEFKLSWEYNKSLFEKQTIERLAEGFEVLLSSCLHSPQKKIAEQTVLPSKQLNTIISFGNAHTAAYPENSALHHLFEQQVLRTPDQTALVFDDQSMTYQSLNRMANQLARAILEKYQFNQNSPLLPSTPIALYLERSFDMIIAILAVLKAGGAYVPISIDLPEERVRLLLDDVDSSIVLTQTKFSQKLLSAMDETQVDRQILVDNYQQFMGLEHRNLDRQVSPDDLAYIIYTSGTTGKPKGVMLPHNGVVNRIHWMQKQYQLTELDRVLQKTPYSFDVSVWELLWANWVGATIVIAAPDEHKDPQALHNLIERHHITTLHFVPSMLNGYCQYIQAINEKIPLSVRQIFCSGEALAQEHVSNFNKVNNSLAGLHNLYGPTEASIDVTYYDNAQHSNGAVPIGKPIDNIELCVLDDYLQPTPIGVAGELYIAGIGLAKGYFNRQSITDASFKDLASSDGKVKRFYKTGDLVSWQADGNIRYIGRTDFQVKIRGFRIELGEIEFALSSHPQINNCVVVVLEREERKYLAAYFTCLNEVPTHKALTQWLTSLLPSFMLPSTFTHLSELPLSANGKLDRAQLPAPDSVSEDTFQLPRNKLEQTIHDVWCKVLGIEKINIYDNFFKIGGDSIVSIQLVAQLRKSGVELQVKDIFDSLTIAALAERADQNKDVLTVEAEQGMLTGEFSLLPIQTWFMGHRFEQPGHWNQTVTLKITENISVKDIASSFNKLELHHDVLRLLFRAADDNKWQQVYQHKSTQSPLRSLDVSQLDESALIDTLTHWQSLFDYREGPLWGGALLTGYQDGYNRLWISVHHLLIDGVSWRILLTDLEKLLQGKALDKKTASYRQWANVLSGYSNANNLEVNYWQKTMANYRPLLCNDERKTSSFIVTSELTHLLLRKANKGYNTQINDLLLASFALALKAVFKHDEYHVTLETHGRHWASDKLDTSRTIGWFTSLVPVQLNVDPLLSNTIINAKTSTGSAPNNGLGFGLLSQAGLIANDVPDICFNYLGQLDNESAGNDNLLSLTNEPTGLNYSSANHAPFKLEVNGAIREGKLGFTIKSALPLEVHQLLTTSLEQAIENVITDAVNAADNGGIKTVSDFSLNDFDMKSLERLQQKYAIQDIYPATSLQQGFIHHQLRYPEDEAYRVQVVLEYKNKLNIELYQKAWQLTFQKFPGLRVAFDWEDGIPKQVINNNVETDIQLVDLSHFAVSDQLIEIGRLQHVERAKKFDLSKAGLMRMLLIQCAENRYFAIKTAFHGISDGWSEPIIWHTLHRFYSALLDGNSPRIEEDKAYVESQKYYLTDNNDCYQFWQKEKLQFNPSNDLRFMLDQEVDLNAINVIDKTGERQKVIDGIAYSNLKAVVEKLGITLNTAVQFAWHKLLSFYSSEQQTIAGITVSGRELPIEGIETSVGNYINTLPLAINWNKEQSISKQLQDIQQKIAELNHHSYVPLAKLQSNDERLFHSFVVFENYPIDTDASGGTLKFQLHSTSEKSNYPITILAYEKQQSLVLRMVYSENLIDDASVDKYLSKLALILAAISRDPDMLHNQLDIVTVAEREDILQLANQNDGNYAISEPIHSVFKRQIEQSPNNVAVVSDGISLTYSELHLRINHLANELIAQYKTLFNDEISSGTFIPIYVDQGIDSVIARLAVLYAGGVYVPIELQLTNSQTAQILKDIRAPFIITQKAHKKALNDVLLSEGLTLAIFTLSDDISALKEIALNTTATDLAYISYQFSTANKPKGIMFEQRSIINFSLHNAAFHDISEGDCVALFVDGSRETGVFELMYQVLLSGASLLILSDEDISASDKLQVTVENYSVTHVIASEHLLAPIFDSLKVESLKRIITRANSPEFHFSEYNNENLVYEFGHPEVCQASHQQFNSEVIKAHRKTLLGSAIQNLSFYVVDERSQLLPKGAPGELVVGGEGIARGYLNHENDCFISHSVISPKHKSPNSECLFKTGDIVRWLPDGSLEYLGHSGNQTRIKGYSVNLSKVEHALQQYAGVKDCKVVNLSHSENTSLVAYLVGIELDEQLESCLQQYASEKLAPFMVPDKFVAVERLPVNDNGMVDVSLLPKPELEKASFEAPSSELELVVSEIWKSALGIEKISVLDNFFTVGGDSIIAIKVISMLIQKELKIDLQTLYENPTIRELVTHFEAQQEDDLEEETLII